MTVNDQNTVQSAPETESNLTAPETGTQGNEANVDDKKKKKYLAFDARMAAIRAGLTNAEKPGLFRDSIEQYGYNDVRIADGRKLFNDTETARGDQLKAIAAKDQKFRDAAELREEIHDDYMHMVVIGREEFKKDSHMLALLGLNGPRKETIATWRGQVNQLYGNTGEPGVSEGYANHNITTEILDAKKQKLTNWDSLIADIKAAKSEAESATEGKNKVYRKLLSWWRGFARVVDVAVEENPQLKEQISVVTPTTK
ncbi:MAG: hypothetical protein GY950_17380 [bacterium]|nr:hypothetical protein [bacterium]